MLIIIVSILGIFFACFGMLLVAANLSQRKKRPGIKADRLQPCSNKPNCVCSEFVEDNAHFISPIPINSIAEAPEQLTSLDFLQPSIERLGGQIKIKRQDYVAAEFESRFLGFIDDLEIRLDTHHQLLQLRSAARVGYSDMGVNRRRVAKLRNMICKN